MHPCILHSDQAPGLYTYYAVMSLIVVILAISLIWFPLVQLINEVITVVTKVLIYADKELLGHTNGSYVKSVDTFFHSQNTLIMISVSCLAYTLYLASGDFLLFAGSYFCNFPNHGILEKIKKVALDIIACLLKITGKKRQNTENGKIFVNYHQGRPVHH